MSSTTQFPPRGQALGRQGTVALAVGAVMASLSFGMAAYAYVAILGEQNGCDVESYYLQHQSANPSSTRDISYT